MLTIKRWLCVLFIYLIPVVCVLGVCPFIGGEHLEAGKILSVIGSDSVWSTDAEIFFYFRIPRILLALLAGGTLALTGAVFQGILRNPLATPYTLGVTGGSSLGAVTAILLPTLNVARGPFSAVQLSSLIGAALVMAFIYLLAARSGGMSMNTLLLAGVTISIFCGAMITFLRYLASPNLLVSIEHWLLGGLDVMGFQELSVIFPLLVPGVGLLFMQMNTLNHLELGEELATGYGVDVKRVQQASFLGGCLATTGVVSLTGPIGFVGLVVPHAVRKLSGIDYRIVLPASFLTGGALLVVCDTVARTIIYPTEIPTGVITSIVGVPCFIYLLLARKSVYGSPRFG